ncbi:DinB family protein [Mucilaginibacter terrae]|uniref:Damage-inducible protein DinB n=1 Tax=Mucilaginibacter terrae TaxID=1955052 RepID=A0ABU3GPD4_9SPHI|nr:DinB family protein [Mucilaginibacter terrae]MDT3401626.1 putative damage-inducible protein DinB [Mucilaginibacter terrae]
METAQLTESTQPVLSPDQLFAHWQGHRNLTRKTIEAFPEAELFNHSIGGMRTFAELVMEIIDLTGPGIEGIVTGKWKTMDELSHTTCNYPKTKEGILAVWDETTQLLNELAPQVTTTRLNQTEAAFGMYEDKLYSTLLYFIDNEIHHRAQGFVYLRSLGIAPPPFWERF